MTGSHEAAPPRVTAHAPRPTVATREVGAKSQHKPVQFREIIHLVWRIVTFSAAMLYVIVSLRASILAGRALGGTVDNKSTFVPYKTQFLQSYLAPLQARVRDTKLVQLLPDTQPRNHTMYLESATEASFTGCSRATPFNAWLYSNQYLRELWIDLVTTVAHSASFLASNELVLPVIDCSFRSIQAADDTVLRVFYIVRSKQNSEDVSIVTLSLSVQDYRNHEEHQCGAAGIAVFTAINELAATSVEYSFAAKLGYPYPETHFESYRLVITMPNGLWQLEGIVPPSAINTASKVIQTASCTGFCFNTESTQSNIKNLHLELSQSPIQS